MDVNFSAKPQTLSLFSRTPHSSSSSLSLISPWRIQSLRGEFLGCGHNLRPPGLRSRRKCKKLEFHIQSPRIIFRASLDSQSMVVVSVVTISALTVVYLNLNYSKRKKDPKEMSGQLTLALSRKIRGMMNWVIMDRIWGPLDLQGETSADESKDSRKEMKEISHDSEDRVAQLQLNETALMREETFIMDTLKSPGSDIVASCISGSISSRESEVMGLSSLPSLHHESGPLPFTFATEICEMHLEGSEQEPELGSELCPVMVKTELIAASLPTNNVLAGVNEVEDRHHQLVKRGEISSYNGICGESVRKELYTFYEANQSAMRYMENFNGLKSLSSHASLPGNNSFSSLTRSSTIEGENFSAQDFLHTAGNFEGKLPLGCYKEGSSHKRKDLGERRGSTSDKEKRILHQNVHRNVFPSPNPKGKHINDRNYPPQQFISYNRLLRDGRLIDCIEMLEDMGKKGLLDMDKVYHAGFFRVCKSQKAVKEAFRFTKLIRNPTLSTFNMLMAVCASSQDSEGAFQVLKLVQEAGLKADCKLYTTLISTCAKCGKVDLMFKVFHEMVNAEVEPNVHTYGALIDGCAKAGQVAKAFGAYGIMSSKNVKPDRVIFNALINACGQAGAVDRAFDVLAEMRADTQPIDPDHVTVGALIKACADAGQIDRVREVYHMIHEYNIKGSPEVYTIAVNSCSQTGDWEFACRVYNDMTRKGVVPDEMFVSALIDVAGHAGKVDAAFEILQEARAGGLHVGIMSYSSLMGACSNAKNWQKALELYESIKAMNLKPTVSTMNALITALCDGDQLQNAVEALFEMKRVGLCPNTITYSILFMATEKKDDVEVGLMLLSQSKKDGLAPNLVMCRCLIAMCFRRFEKASTRGEPVLSFNSGQLQIDIKWTSVVLMVYRETIIAGVVPTMEELSHVLGCLRLPHDVSLRNRLIENLGVSTDTSKGSNLCSLIGGFGEYDPRAFSLLEEAASLGIVPCVSFKESPLVVDLRKLPIHTAEVYLLTVLKGLKHRLAAGAKLPNITILLPIEKTLVQTAKGEKKINLAGRISQAVAALLRRLGLPYLGNGSYGKIRINGIVVKKWFKPKLVSPFSGNPTYLSSSQSRLGRGITHQQRNIRTGNLSLE